MRKNKAIHIIQNQINKLKDPSNHNHSWCTETRTYLKKFFGEQSEQEKFFHYFSFSSGPNESTVDEKIKDLTKFLGDCINTIKNIGLYNPPTDNWFSKLPNWAINLGLPAICIISFSLGSLLSNNNNKELRKENSQLKEELLLVSTDSISNQHKDLSDNPKGKN